MSDSPLTAARQYSVEVDHDGCPHCSVGRTWTIVGPDGDALGQSWGDKELVDDLAELLNDAFENGARRTLLADAAVRVHRSEPIDAPSFYRSAPIPLDAEQEAACKSWAADDRLWTTQETVEINLRTFARVILKSAEADLAVRAQEIEQKDAEIERLRDWQATVTAARFALDEARRTISVGHPVRAHIEATLENVDAALTRAGHVDG